MEFKEVMNWLVVNQYVAIHKGKPVFTDKARTELNTVGKPPAPGLVPPPPPSKLPATIGVDYEEQYKQFIMLCKVPPKALDTYGRPYALNKFSIEGALAFKKALEKGYKLEVLAVAVALYYKSGNQFKKTIGNYMVSGEWQTDYDKVVEKAAQGNLAEHIKTESNGPISWYTRG